MGAHPEAFGSCPYRVADPGSATLSVHCSQYGWRVRARPRGHFSRNGSQAKAFKRGGEGRHAGRGTCSKAHRRL